MNRSVIELNPTSRVPLILLGEHAGFALPAGVNRLGVPLSPFQTDANFASDHGVRRILFQLARAVGATTLLGRYSRLLIDLNRDVSHSQLIWNRHHNIDIPANQAILNDEKERRLHNYYTPFHNRVRFHIERLQEMGKKPVLLTVHSYTPSVAAQHHNRKTSLPDVGFLFYKESQMLAQFEQAYCQSPWSSARNAPYDLQALQTGSLVMHQKAFDLDGLALEINVDHLRTFTDQNIWADFITRVIENNYDLT